MEPNWPTTGQNDDMCQNDEKVIVTIVFSIIKLATVRKSEQLQLILAELFRKALDGDHYINILPKGAIEFKSEII